MKKLVIAAVLIGCSSPSVAPALAPVAQGAPGASIPECATTKAAPLDSRLREDVVRDPLRLMRLIGVGVDDYERISRILYGEWLKTHKPATPPVVVDTSAGARGRIENGVNVIPIDHPMYCFTVAGSDSPAKGPMRMCASTMELCTSTRLSSNSVGPCEAERAAACFTTRNTVSGQTAGWCFQGIDDCRIGMQVTKNDADLTLVYRDCYVMRYEP